MQQNRTGNRGLTPAAILMDREQEFLELVKNGLCGGGEEPFELHQTHQAVAESVVEAIADALWIPIHLQDWTSASHSVLLLRGLGMVCTRPEDEEAIGRTAAVLHRDRCAHGDPGDARTCAGCEEVARTVLAELAEGMRPER